jgi:hypothetical protein
MNKRRLTYILSPSYSGSTLLTMLMARHPRIATIGELKATSMGDLEHYTCSCGSPIIQCGFWTTLIERLRTQGVVLDLHDFGTHFTSKQRFADRVLRAQVRMPLFESVRRLVLSALPNTEKEFDRIMKKNRLMIEAICDLQGKDIFLDGSKDPHRLLYFINSGLWDIQVIKMYRDGRAQSNSNRQKEINGMNYAESALEWKRTINQMDAVCRYLPDENIFELKYENLCAEPNEIMAELWRFLDVAPETCDWREVNIKEFEHHILGNNMRTKEKIHIRLDSGWKERVTAAELEDFRRIAGSTNQSLGYEG